MILGDTFDHLDITLEITETDLIFEFATGEGHGDPPPWAPRPGIRKRRAVRRSEVVRAGREAAFLRPDS